MNGGRAEYEEEMGKRRKPAMKINYHCELCGSEIAMLDVEYVDETKFGFDCLTGDERKAIIDVDTFANTMHVKSLCDHCIGELGLDEAETELPVQWGKQILH